MPFGYQIFFMIIFAVIVLAVGARLDIKNHKEETAARQTQKKSKQ
ncbi:hypothetical protein C4J86_0803 [Pseudomonas sp. R2-7-07]|nr:hypothetical protein C4J94_0799 [Pseudomonas sp. R5-89-07]AZF46056.1 hypothetical protein C4J86_0803 [Pseudomonas sp. R2-7-07]